MFKIINKICPESLHGKFAERSSTSKYNTRNKTDLQIPRLNLDYSRKSFHYTGLKTWNVIPTQLRESNTLTQFKNGLKNHFLSRKKTTNYIFIYMCMCMGVHIYFYMCMYMCAGYIYIYIFTHESMEEQYWLLI